METTRPSNEHARSYTYSYTVHIVRGREWGMSLSRLRALLVVYDIHSLSILQTVCTIPYNVRIRNILYNVHTI